MSDLTLIRGDDKDIPLVAGVDLTGCDVRFTARYRAMDTTAVFAKTSEPDEGVAIAVGDDGEFTVTIEAADWDAYTGTGDLVYDVEVTDGSGKVTTVLLDRISVTQDVSR